MLTKKQAETASRFEHLTLKNADGTPLRARRTGKTRTWATRVDEFKVPVKYGLRQSFYITQADAANWRVAE